MKRKLVSIVTGNYFKQRPGETEPLVTFDPSGQCFLHLRDYAVIPLEEYETLWRAAHRKPGDVPL